FFFFQAEDGIRDLYVTGVQTCALPISHVGHEGVDIIKRSVDALVAHVRTHQDHYRFIAREQFSPVTSVKLAIRREIKLFATELRSEERRVGKECRSREAPEHEKKRRKK